MRDDGLDFLAVGVRQRGEGAGEDERERENKESPIDRPLTRHAMSLKLLAKQNTTHKRVAKSEQACHEYPGETEEDSAYFPRRQ